MYWTNLTCYCVCVWLLLVLFFSLHSIRSFLFSLSSATSRWRVCACACKCIYLLSADISSQWCTPVDIIKYMFSTHSEKQTRERARERARTKSECRAANSVYCVCVCVCFYYRDGIIHTKQKVCVVLIIIVNVVVVLFSVDFIHGLIFTSSINFALSLSLSIFFSCMIVVIRSSSISLRV